MIRRLRGWFAATSVDLSILGWFHGDVDPRGCDRLHREVAPPGGDAYVDAGLLRIEQYLAARHEVL